MTAPVDVLAVMDRCAKLLPEKDCCRNGVPGYPGDPPECCGEPDYPQDELAEARAAVAELIEVADAARIELNDLNSAFGSESVDTLVERLAAALARVQGGAA